MSSLDRMRTRASFDGYAIRDKWNVEGKYKSFIDALRSSYQGEFITFNDNKYRCLINPDKLKENYDQKMISIDFNAGVHNGDTFYWDRTDSHWLIYLQDYSEEAYFRASIRRCDYQIDVNGHPYWIYLRGPVETAIIWRQKHQLEFNDLNYSILFYIQKNEETYDFFERFKVIKFDGHNWRVAAIDRYSQDGIIEVYCEEYFDNEMEDQMIEPVVVEPDKMHPYIDGPQTVRPFDKNIVYSIVGITSGTFLVDSDKVEFINADETSCVLKITTGKSGKFNLIYRRENEEDITLEVTIKSL